MKKTLYLLLVILAHPIYAQQDPLLSQYQFNQLPVNPAYAGVNDVASFDLQYRSQWGGVEGAPTTVLLSGHSSFFQNQVGLGFSLVHDQVGINTNTDFNLTYAYELEVASDVTLSFGLQTGLMSLQYDFNELTLEDPTDEDFINADDGFTKFNVGTGLFLSNERFYIGLSIPRLLKVQEDIGEKTGERYNQHYYVTGGLIIDQLSSVVLKPYVVTRISEGASVSADIGVNALFADLIWGGIFTRNFETVGINTFLNLNNGIRIGYTGELVSNDLSSGFNTHEVSLGIDLELFSNQVVARRYY
ncbi:MAG: type IX secretion system membrane protein PorP/SprF [Bacteroidota bacterium]